MKKEEKLTIETEKETITETRPWGSFTILEDSDTHKVKRLTVLPGKILSLQSHNRRAEHWVVVTGQAYVVNGDKELTLNYNESTYIPIGNKHRLGNKTNEILEVIEIQTGDYFGEDDIVRYDDEYGRS
ncbi:MAG: phosphomannose isomerase type II C-terminal cupin domain [Nanoarchaeales archaeon]|nr:phosphomannose isomerase type II C-terminal cupin domain [Nanoarchaeales archaeon]